MAEIEGLPKISTWQSSWWAGLYLDVDDRWVGVQQLAEVGTNVFLSQCPGGTASRLAQRVFSLLGRQSGSNPPKKALPLGYAAAGNATLSQKYIHQAS